MAVSNAVKLANKATSKRLASMVETDYELASKMYRVEVLHGDELQATQREAVWVIFEANMRELYQNSSFGWDPETKRKELFHNLSRFVLVQQDESPNPLVAFSMFRFEQEDEDDVLYCYDIQVATTAQGAGIGKRLLNALAIIGKAFRMEMILLTVFKANVNALKFYTGIGFRTDVTSPDYVDNGEEVDDDEVEGADYKILSRQL
ncbi:acyl-CoA N-acyltransferase [Crassisporium funariophilum]|nr:acyl-CoA N-acyltransferase [Crassisporium funariophilum]